jgi:hypothetical protein
MFFSKLEKMTDAATAATTATKVFVVNDKPTDWPEMPLYKKIKFYASALTPDYLSYIDKLDVKKLVADIVVCAPLIRILESCEDFHYEDLNTDFMVKASHGCGWNISIQKTTTRDFVLKRLQRWNTIYEGDEEPLYHMLKPRFYLEKKINCYYSGKNGVATTFYIRCLHGTPFAIGVRQGNVQNSYDVDWNLIKDPEIPVFEKPHKLQQMLEIAAKLSAPFEFVRIDLYIDKDETIVFSEFTFTPSGGAQFYSDALETRFGKLWL